MKPGFNDDLANRKIPIMFENLKNSFVCWKSLMRSDVASDGLIAFVFWCSLNESIAMKNRSDSRILLFRHVSSKYIKGKGWKLSVSLHPYWFYWRREFREFRLTVLGLNIHFRRK